jgi:hypothetical protein
LCKHEDSFRRIGHENWTKLQKEITDWLSEAGLSENALKIKLLNLLDAEETKIVKISGAVNPESLPDRCRVLCSTGSIESDKDSGEHFGTGETVLAISIRANETQRRTLDMAMKAKGMYAPERHEVTGEKGGPIETRMVNVPPAPKTISEWLEMCQEIDHAAQARKVLNID